MAAIRPAIFVWYVTVMLATHLRHVSELPAVLYVRRLNHPRVQELTHSILGGLTTFDPAANNPGGINAAGTGL